MIWICAAAGLAMVVVGILGFCAAAHKRWDDDDALRDAGYTDEDIARMHRNWAHSHHHNRNLNS